MVVHSQRTACLRQTGSTTVLHLVHHQSQATCVLWDVLPGVELLPPMSATSPIVPVKRRERCVDDPCNQDATSRTTRSTTARTALGPLQSLRSCVSPVRRVSKPPKEPHAVDPSALVLGTCRCARTSSQMAVVSRRTPSTSVPRAAGLSWTRTARVTSRAYRSSVAPLVLRPTASALRMDPFVGENSHHHATSMLRPCTRAIPVIVLSLKKPARLLIAMSPHLVPRLLLKSVSILVHVPVLIW